MSKANAENSQDSTLNERLEQVIPLLGSVIRNACRRYRHPTSADEVARLKQRLILHLLENANALDGFRQQASLHTWLQKVANNYISRFLQQERRLTVLEDVLPALFIELE